MAAFLVAAVAVMIGHRLLPRGARHVPGPARWALALAIGYASLSAMAFLLATLGWLTEATARWALAIAAAVVVLPGWNKKENDQGQEEPEEQEEVGTPRPGFEKFALAVLLVAAALPLVLALYPSVGFDANTYHLAQAHSFLMGGSLPILERLRYPVFPPFQELLYALVLAFSPGEQTANFASAQLLHALAGLATVPLVALWVRAPRERSPLVGWIAAAMWLGTPVVVYISSLAYVDLALTLAIAAAATCVLQASTLGHRAPRDELSWLLCAGLLLGVAMGTKYLALFFLPAFAIALVVLSPRRPLTERLGRAGVLVAVASLVALPVYLRLWTATGNPLFPYYEGFFGQNAWSQASTLPPGGFATKLTDLVLVSIRGAFDRTWLGGRPPLHPLAALLVVLALGSLPGSHRARAVAVGVLAYAILWTTTVMDLRFLLPVTPFVLAGAALTLRRFVSGSPSPPGRKPVIAAALIVVLATPGIAYGARKLWQRGALPVSEAQRTAWLDDRIDGYGALRATLARDPGACLYADRAETLHAFAPRHVLGAQFGPDAYGERPAGGEELVAWLQARGASHLLILGDEPIPGLERAALVLAQQGSTVYRIDPASGAFGCS